MNLAGGAKSEVANQKKRAYRNKGQGNFADGYDTAPTKVVRYVRPQTEMLLGADIFTRKEWMDCSTVLSCPFLS